MNSILMESNSPTQQRTQKDNVKVIESTIMDDREISFPVRIEYIHTRWMFKTTIEWMDFNLCPDALFLDTDLKELIRDEIRREEGSCDFDC